MSTRAFSPALVLVAAIATGAAMDATIKHLAHTNNVLLVIVVRYAIAVLFSLAIWTRAGAPRISPEMWRAHTVRGVVIALASSTFFWAITVLPLVEAVTLTFIYPLIVPFIGAAMLGERVRLPSVLAAAIGFAGVAVSMAGAPSAQQSPLHPYGVAAVLFSAVAFSISILLMRARAQKDGPEIVGIMASLIPGLILAGPAIAVSPPPNLADWPGFLFLGFIAALFMYLIAHAYARAEAQQLAPIHCTELLWASLYGYLLFHETPRPQVFLGAILIVAACLCVAYEERKLTAKAASPA